MDANLHAVFNAHGLYNTEQFVLRLSPVNHRLIDEAEARTSDGERYTQEEIRAYSTYLHETIHWWQHVGSTTGFVLSLCYPNQTHQNQVHLRNWVKLVEPIKSIRSWALKGERSGITHADGALAEANVIVNNSVDLDYFKRWLMQPGKEKAIYDDPYFESQGHCFWMSYSILLGNLAPQIDPNHDLLPDPEDWGSIFRDLSENKVQGYYHGSPMIRRRIGVMELFEGQACFSQLQFLAGASGERRIQLYRQSGILHGVYARAFARFLEVTKLEEPVDVMNSVVALFLLVCDLSINPVEGFPCEIYAFEQFVLMNDPGIRFEILCGAIRDNPSKYRTRIQDFSKAEFMQVSAEICEDTNILHPEIGWNTVLSWCGSDSEIVSILNEKAAMNFSQTNMVQRLLLSYFISISKDRKEHPEFFCWPGYWKSVGSGEEWVRSIWLRNLSLFTDREDNDGVFIRNMPGAEEGHLAGTLNSFFGNNLFYDLTRQWILEDNGFSFGFDWLAEGVAEADWMDLAARLFKRNYGVAIHDIKTA